MPSGACHHRRPKRPPRRLRRMSTGKKWLVRFFLLVFIALVTMGLWLPPIITHAVEKDYHFPEVDIDATVLPNGDLMLEETRTFDFQNGPFTYAYFNVDDPLDHVRDFTIAEKLDDGTEVPVTPDYASHSIVTEGFQSQWSYSAEDETRTWVFRYRVACAVDVYSDTAHLYWQFIGSGWDQPTQHAVITVHLPGHSASDARRPRACHPDEGVILDVGQTPLTRGRGARLRARAAERRGHVREPTDDPVRRARRATALVRGGVDPVPGRRRADRRRDRSTGPRTHPGPGARLGRRGQRPARTPRDRTRLGPLPADRRAGRARAAGAAGPLPRPRAGRPEDPRAAARRGPRAGFGAVVGVGGPPLAAERVPGTAAQARAPRSDRDEGRRPRLGSEGPHAGPEDGRDGSADRARPGLHVVAVRTRRGCGRRGLGQPPEAPQGRVLRDLRGVVVRREDEVRPTSPFGSARATRASSRPWRRSSRSARPATASGRPSGGSAARSGGGSSPSPRSAWSWR